MEAEGSKVFRQLVKTILKVEVFTPGPGREELENIYSIPRLLTRSNTIATLERSSVSTSWTGIIAC